RRDAVVQSQGVQGIVVAAAQDHAASTEPRVVANFPATTIDDDRRSTVVGADALEVVDGSVECHGTAAKSFTLVKGDRRDRLGASERGGDGQGALQDVVIH